MKSVFILSFLFLFFCMGKTMCFLLKMMCKDKDTIKNTKSQQENCMWNSEFWSNKLDETKKKNLETQHNGITLSYYLYNFVIYYFDS